jgi:hypothetical protein
MTISTAGGAGKERSIANLVGDAVRPEAGRYAWNPLPADRIWGIVHCTNRLQETPMNPEPHPGAGAIGAAAGYQPAALFPEVAQALVLSHRLATLWSGAGVAFCALTANRALLGQVQLAHAFAGHARVHSKSLAGIGELALPPGPAREVLLGTARLVESFADRLAESANRYGRAFGHLAFAFPVPDRRA